MKVTDKPNTVMDAIDGIARSFEELKKANEQKQSAEAAGNIARMQELQGVMEKINDQIGEYQKNKEVLERKLAAQQERVEILEAVNSRPGKTVADKIKDEHKSLFMRWIRSGGKDQRAEEEYKALQQKAREVKDVSLTDAAGGAAVPEEISRAIDNLVLKQSFIAQNVKNVAAGTSDYKELISINDTTYEWAAETGTRNAQGEPTLRTRTPTWGELYTYLTATNWSLEDIFFNVEGWLVETAAEQFSRGLSAAIYNGNGSAKPTGIFNSTPVTTDDGSPQKSAEVIEYLPISSPSSPYTSTGITAKTLIDLVYATKPAYAMNGKFAMNRVTQGHVRKLTDTSGQFLWQPSLQAGQPDRLLGFEVFTWEDLGNPTTANAYPVVFGDFKRAYTLVTRSGLQVVRENVTAPGFTKFFMARRYGGILTNNEAIKVAKVAVS
jgi:HK97 family phage major capsid protein